MYDKCCICVVLKYFALHKYIANSNTNLHTYHYDITIIFLVYKFENFDEQ